jgi:hypothetical protein
MRTWCNSCSDHGQSGSGNVPSTRRPYWRDSLADIVTVLWNGWWYGFQFLPQARELSLFRNVLLRYGAFMAFNSMVTGGSSHGCKSSRVWSWPTSHLHLVWILKNMWSYNCSDVIYVKLFCFEVKSSELWWILGIKVPYSLWWLYTEGIWLYCDCFIWCTSCTVVVLTGFVMCGCFVNMCTCIYCVLYCLYCVLYCFVYVYLLLFVLSVWFKDYCHWVTTQLQLVIAEVWRCNNHRDIPQQLATQDRSQSAHAHNTEHCLSSLSGTHDPPRKANICRNMSG